MKRKILFLLILMLNSCEAGNNSQNNIHFLNKTSETCKQGLTPFEIYYNLRCDTVAISDHYVPRECFSTHPFPLLIENGTPLILNVKVPITSELINANICAANKGDQVALLTLMTLTLRRKIDSKACFTSLPSLVSNNSKSDDSKKCDAFSETEEELLNQLPEYDYLWGLFVSQLKGFKYKNVKTKNDLLKECINVSKIHSVHNKCGIPEIWLLRYNHLKKQNFSENDREIEIAKLIANSGINNQIKNSID